MRKDYESARLLVTATTGARRRAALGLDQRLGATLQK